MIRRQQKQQIICFQVPVKNQKHLLQLQTREKSHIPGTPKLILGRLENNYQQVWVDEFKNYKISSLKEMRSNQKAFEVALQIINATQALSKIYGNFILNENMVFWGWNKKVFIWINPDIFANTVKIYLPQTKQGEVSMTKALINYFKLWFQINYTALSTVKTLKELCEKIKNQKLLTAPSFDKDNKTNSSAGLSFGSSKGGSTTTQFLRLYESSKIVKLRRPLIDWKKGAHSKQQSQNSEKQFVDRCKEQEDILSVKNRRLTCHPLNPKKYLRLKEINFTNNKSHKNPSSQGENQSSLSNNPRHNNISSSFQNLNTLKNIQQIKSSGGKFPNKTTSSTLHILQKIKQQDQNPDVYTGNKILQEQVHDTGEQSHGEYHKNGHMLGGINEELDNLFLSNMQSEQNSEEIEQREKQFEDLLS